MTKDRLLALLKQNSDQLLSGGAAAKELSVSRNAVWKAICSLKEDGFLIDTVPNKGYLYHGHDDSVLSAEELRSFLSEGKIGGRILTYSSVTSTNTEARKLAEEGAPDGTVVWADYQSEGKGRREHSFYSPAGAGIYISVILRPQANLSMIHPLFIRVSLAVTAAIRDICGLDVQVKWPNDIFWRGKKLCGILTNCSVSAEDGLLEYAVAGIGVNVKAVLFPKGIPAVSLEEAVQGPVSRHKLAASILEEIDRFYQKHGLEELSMEEIACYEKQMEQNGRNAIINYPDGGKAAGRVLGISPEGFLQIQTSCGTVSLRSGEAAVQVVE